MRYHPIMVRITIIKKSTNSTCWRQCGEKIGRNVNWYSHYREQYGCSLKKKKKKERKKEMLSNNRVPIKKK